MTIAEPICVSAGGVHAGVDEAVAWELIARFRPCFIYAGLFSLVITLLLALPFYVVHVSNRVLSSRSRRGTRARTFASCSQSMDARSGFRAFFAVSVTLDINTVLALLCSAHEHRHGV
jgi:hypothetical protein